jgi:hypothetical protein
MRLYELVNHTSLTLFKKILAARPCGIYSGVTFICRQKFIRAILTKIAEPNRTKKMSVSIIAFLGILIALLCRSTKTLPVHYILVVITLSNSKSRQAHTVLKANTIQYQLNNTLCLLQQPAMQHHPRRSGRSWTRPPPVPCAVEQPEPSPCLPTLVH